MIIFTRFIVQTRQKAMKVCPIHLHLSRLVGKPTMWFPNRSDTNQLVQAQERARSLKFRI